MRTIAIFCIAIGVATLCPAGDVAAQSPAPQREPLPAVTPRPATGTGATVAVGQVTVVAWAQQDAARQRVLALTGAPATLVELGPAGPGRDSAPASTAPGDGSVWIVASRDDGSGERLWAQRWAQGAWQAPVAGPLSRPYDHHPAIASDLQSRRMWVTWIGENGVDGNATMLYASRWTDNGWSAAEPLPRSVGVPMAPSIAVGPSGTPFVTWAASDGTDAEIWVSARRGGRWSTPVAVSRNGVPDITPCIAATPSGLVVAWISYADDGYVPLVATGSGSDAWSAPTLIDASPGDRPVATSVDGKAAVFWRRLADGPSGGTITSRVLGPEGWAPPVSVATASGSPFGVASTTDGHLVLAFSRPDGRLGVAEGQAAGQRDELESLVAASAATFGAPGASAAADAVAPGPAAAGDPVFTVPENYTAFGDSITNGVVYDPDRRTSPGYRDPLQKMLRAFFGRGTVFNAGVDGETTASGLGRIDNAIADQDPGVIFIMEGTNDIVNAFDVDVVAFNLRRMVQRSYAEKPDIIPLLAQIPPRLDPGSAGFDGPPNNHIDELNALLPGIGADEGAVIVDMNSPFDGHPALMSNDLHPSVAGYQVMAEQWYDAVQPEVLALTNRGDLDSSGRTDGFDLVQLALAFGARLGEQRYEQAADINGDGMIDGFDLDLLIEFFGQDVSSSAGGGN